LLSVRIIPYGLLTALFLNVHIAHSGDLLAVMAIAAGILLLMQK
jgi:hypothetical protein